MENEDENKGLQQSRMENENKPVPVLLEPNRLMPARGELNYPVLSQGFLDEVKDALADSNTHLIGVYGSDPQWKGTFQRVCDQVGDLFDKVLKANVSQNPDVNTIQEDIARQLGHEFQQGSKSDQRAKALSEQIKKHPRILIVLLDLHKKLDLKKVGIPHGADRGGCKILLTSATEDVLSKQMHTQRNINARKRRGRPFTSPSI